MNSTIYTYIVSILALIVSIGSAAGYISKAVKSVKTPEQKQNERITTLEERMTKVESAVSQFKEKFTEIEENSRIQMKALLALLSHGIDGNNTAEMKKAHDEITDYLLRK